MFFFLRKKLKNIDSSILLIFFNSAILYFLGKDIWSSTLIVLINLAFIFLSIKSKKNVKIFIITQIFIFFTIVIELAIKRLSGWYFFQVPLEIINLIMDTNLGEIKSNLFFSFKEYLGFFSIIFNIVFLINIRKKKEFKNQKKYIFSWCLVLLLLLFLTKNPLSLTVHEIYKNKENIENNISSIHERKLFDWHVENNNRDIETVVIFLGETHRGDLLSINGYKRETTPKLKNENIISFSNAISQAPSTLLSTPMILSRKNVRDVGVFPEKSLISAYKDAGFETWYVSYLAPAHIGDNEINLIANEADHYIQSNVSNETFKKILSNKSKKKLIVYKTVGSHYLFHERYPDEFNKFQPSFTGESYSVPSLKDKEKLENTYANSLLYSLDHQVSNFINILKSEKGKVSLSFISDHGTSIYDDGISLYGGRTYGNYSIGLFFWFNEEFSTLNNFIVKQLNENKNLLVTSECFLDTMLDIAAIKSLRKGCSLVNKKTYPKVRIVKDMKHNLWNFDQDKN